MAWEIGGVHSLVTGLNGHGKTLFTVAELLQAIPGSTMASGTGAEVRQIPRRLVVGGIKNLLLDHVLIDVPSVDPETWKDTFRDIVREPGQDPVLTGADGNPIVQSIVNWWLWCMPGDVIVVDECQRVYRPMASGRRVPMFIEKAETARHYGVQFVYITQHPQLLHTNIRSLVGPHRHVRRMFGGTRTVIYEWDHCTHPDRTKGATIGTWKHARRAFGLYASSEAHTKFKGRLPLAAYFVMLAAVAVPGVGYYAYRSVQPMLGKAPPAKDKATAPAAISGGGPATTPMALGIGELTVSPPVQKREPYAGWALHVAGGWRRDAALGTFIYSASIAGRVVATLSDADFVRAGYSVRKVAPCVVVLMFDERERLLVCDTPVQTPTNVPSRVQDNVKSDQQQTASPTGPSAV